MVKPVGVGLASGGNPVPRGSIPAPPSSGPLPPPRSPRRSRSRATRALCWASSLAVPSRYACPPCWSRPVSASRTSPATASPTSSSGSANPVEQSRRCRTPALPPRRVCQAGAGRSSHASQLEHVTRCRQCPIFHTSVRRGSGRSGGVVVEPAAGLATQVPALDASLERLRRQVARVLRDLVGLEPGVVPDVEPREIGELEGPHRVVQPELHRLVDVGEGGDALLEQVVRFAAQGPGGPGAPE